MEFHEEFAYFNSLEFEPVLGFVLMYLKLYGVLLVAQMVIHFTMHLGAWKKSNLHWEGYCFSLFFILIFFTMSDFPVAQIEHFHGEPFVPPKY